MAAESAPDAADIGSELDISIDLAALLRRPGTRREVAIDVRPTGLRTSQAAIDAITGPLTVESMGEKVTATGHLAIAWTGSCRRCLDEATGSVDLDLLEIYELHPVDGETYELPRDDTLNLGPMLAEQALLSLPLAPLCADACVGPAPDLYPAEVVDEEETGEKPPDPRWAALDELTFDDD